MNKRFTLTLLLFATTHFLFGQVWIKQYLSNLATISFPSKPDFKDTLGEIIFKYVEENAYYLIDIKKLTKHDNFQLKEDELDKFYNGFIDGVLEKTKGKLLIQKPFIISGLRGIEIEYTSTANPNLPNLRFKRIIFFNNTIISCDFWTSTANREQTQNDRIKFFNSFAITADKSTLKQYTITEDKRAYNIGYIIGRIFGFIFAIAIIIGIIYLITRGIKKIRGRDND